MFSFIKRVFIAAFNTIKSVIMDIFKNLESVVILSASAIGVSAMLQQLPFHYTLPLWIDASMMIPVISVCIIALLISIYQFRSRFTLVGESI